MVSPIARSMAADSDQAPPEQPARPPPAQSPAQEAAQHRPSATTDIESTDCRNDDAQGEYADRHDNGTGGKLLRHRRAESHSGPIPHPVILQGYEQIVAGSADRILRMAEQESTHIQRMDAGYLNTVLRGQIFGLVSVLCCFSLAAFALYLGHPGVAGTVASTTVVGLVTVFVTNRLADRGSRGHDVSETESGSENE